MAPPLVNPLRLFLVAAMLFAPSLPGAADR
jgi:hypothetical protein